MNAARRIAAATSLLLVLFTAPATHAQSIWQNLTPGDSNWQSAGNWNPSGVPTTGTTAQFDDTGANSATPLSLGSASVGTLNFMNNTNSYTLGSSSDTLAFGGATALNQTGSGSNTINAQISANNLNATISAGTLSVTNSSNSITGASSFSVSNGAVLNATGTSLGTAAVNLNNGTLVLGGAVSTFAGLNSQYWPLSPGDNSSRLGNGSGSNTWNTTSGATVLATVSNFGPAIVQQILANNSTPANIGNGPGYGAPNNPFSGAAPATGYVGGVDFPNSGNGTNAFAAVGVNISGQGTTGPNYTGPGGGYNNISAMWSGNVNIPAGGGNLNFNVDSDDFSAVIVDGNIVLNRGNGGTGFSGNGNGGQGTGGNINLSAGAHSIEVVYDEGGGNWGIVGMYSFTPTGGSAGPATYIGNNDATDGVTFSYSTFANLSPSTNPINSTGNSTVTINSGSAESIGLVTLNAGTNLTINGGAPSATFAGLVLNGASTINNSMPVTAGPVTAGTGFTSLTAAGSGNLFLDNLSNTAFTAGTTINATGSGQVVGVNIGGTNSLGLATLNLNGGNFSLGTNGGTNQSFANPVSVSGGGGTITAQTLGAGTNDNGTVNLTGGITLSGGTLNLNASNGYQFAVGNSISGNGTITANANVTLIASSPSYSGTYNVNGGTTTASAGGGNEFGTAFVNVNNGATLNMNTAGDTLGSGASINNGNLNLNASNININNTTVGGNGTLNVGASGGTGNVTMNNGSIIQAQGGTQTFGGNLNLNGGTTSVGNSGQNLNLTGSISGTGSLSQNGSGTTTLSGPLSYQGATNANAGTLALQSPLTGGGAVNVASAGNTATLNVGPGGSLNSSPLVVSPNGNVTVTGSTLGSGSVNVAAYGSVQFNPGSANTASYTGTTMNFNGGTISASSGTANLSGTNLVATPFVAAVTTANNALTALGYNQNSQVWSNNNPANGGFAAMNNILTGNNGANPADWSTQLSAAHNFNTSAPINANSGINQPNGGADLPFYNFFTGHTDLTTTTPNSGDFNFTAGFFGTFTAPVTGLYHFQVGQNDDNAGVIIDTTGTGHFNAGDQYAGIGCCGGSTGFNTFLTAGQSALLGFVNQDTGGGSGLVAQFSLPGGPLQVVDPSQAGQAGYWQIQSQMQSGGATANVGTNATLNVNSFTGFTNVNFTNGSTLGLTAHSGPSAVSSDTTNMSVTGTNPTAALNLGAFNTVHVQNLSVVGGGTLNVAGIGGVGGTLKVDGVGGPGAGTVAVTGGVSFGGAGSFAGTLSIGSGGILAPGDAANTTVGGLTLGDNSTMTYNLNTANVEHMAYSPANGNDLTTVTNTNGLAISSNSYVFGTDGTTVNVIAGANFSRGTYELLAYTGTFTGSLSSFGIGSAPAGYQYQFTNLLNPGGGGGQIDLQVVPEPSAVVLMVLGLAGLGFGYRRRMAKRMS
jgi:hypothetical protein